MLALWFLACTPASTPSASADAPFDIGRLVSQKWIVDPDTDAEDGQGILVLSTKDLDCGELSTAGDDLDELVLDGEGILFYIGYNSWGDNQHGEDWTGLWMGGYAYSGTRGERMMYSLAFSDGFLYFLDGYYSSYFGSSSWLRVDSADDGLKGSYQTNYWSGDFKADSCGKWEEEVRDTGRDTGWDSWR